MSRRKTTAGEMVATKNKNKVSCSTPDHTLDSPSRDSDSMYDSETASPVPFLCTQDSSDVVWNDYVTNPKISQPKNSTPVSKKERKPHRLNLPEKKLHSSQPKRKGIRPMHKKAQLPKELLELNLYVDKLNEQKNNSSQVLENPQSGSEEDIFADRADCTPQRKLRPKRCLRKNVLSSGFSKPESETGLESDDSINESLVAASQAVEENIVNKFSTKQPSVLKESNVTSFVDLTIDDDSMDAILRSVTSPYVNKLKHESPGLKNDSFDNLVGGLNDSAMERLSQMPVINGRKENSDKIKGQHTNWKVKEVVVHDASPSSRFSRHCSMPESPSIPDHSRPSTSNAMALGRYNSMPFNDSNGKQKDYSQTPCTTIEIQKKRHQAREKLLAKGLLPFTQTQQTGHSLPSQATTQTTETVKKPRFQVKVPTVIDSPEKVESIQKLDQTTLKHNSIPPSRDLQSLLERKRKEALIKLRRRQLRK